MSTGDPEHPPFPTDPSRDPGTGVGESWASAVGRAIESIRAFGRALQTPLPASDDPPDLASESSGNYADLGAGGLVIGSQVTNGNLTFSATNPANAPVVTVASDGILTFNGSSYMTTGPGYDPPVHPYVHESWFSTSTGAPTTAPSPPPAPDDRWLDGERAIKLREAARSV